MRIRYENTMDDLLAFQEYYLAHSPAVKRTMAVSRWGVAVFVFALCFVLLMLTKGKRTIEVNLMLALAGGTIYALIFPGLMGRSVKQNAIKMYSEGGNKGFLCEHELEIVEDGIIERTSLNETKTAWAAVGKVSSTPEHTFIYISSIMAHVIPHKRLIEGDYRAFMEELGQRYKPDQTLQPASRG